MYQVDCQNIASYEDFIAAFNHGLIELAGGKWNGNLDAFSDYLSWPKDAPYTLRLLGTNQCERVLSYVTKDQQGRALWSILKEIFHDNQQWLTVDFK